MKIHRRFFAMAAVVLSLLLSGCGTPLYELTADEEALIIKYAAHFIAKHNIYQKDGISVEIAEEDTQEDSEEIEDTQNPDSGEVEQLPTLAEVMNLPKGIKLTYEKSYVADHIKQGVGYSEEAGVGFTFYVISFQMKNTSDKAITIDNDAKDIVFQLTQDSIITKSKEFPLLDAELTAFKGTLKPGESVEVLLLFKVNASDGAKITNPTIEKVDGKNTQPVKL